MPIDFTLKKGDTRPSIEQTLVDDEGEVIPLAEGDEVFFWMGLVDEGYTHFHKLAEIVDMPTSKVRYDWVAGDTDDVADFDAEWRVYRVDLEDITFPNSYYLKVRILDKVELEV